MTARGVAVVGVALALGCNAAGIAFQGRPSADTVSYPLVQRENLIYQGAFRVPGVVLHGNGSSTFAYGGTGLAFNPKNNSLFMVGHTWYQEVAEISVPEVRSNASVNALATATLLQPFAEMTEGRLPSVNPGDPNGIQIGGLLPYRDKLYATAFAYYDGNGTQSVSHFVSGQDLSVRGDVGGPYRVGQTGYTSGYMGLVPAAWQSALGGPVLNGQCCLNIISRTSYGPALFTIDPADIGVKDPAPATPLVYYPGNRPLAAWDATSPYFNGTTQVKGVVFPEGTRSVLFFGRQGLGTFCYGTGGAGGECNDPTDRSKGTHAYPYAHYVWAYDALDLVAVKNGEKQPWDVKPYAIWSLDLPNVHTSGAAILAGAAYDPATGRIFVSQAFGDGDRPLIHVFTTGTLPSLDPPPPPTDPSYQEPPRVFFDRTVLNFRGTNNGAAAARIVPASAAPIGELNGPNDGAVFYGPVAIAGWVLDDGAELPKVEIWRDSHPLDPPSSIWTAGGERQGKVWVGQATVIDGARPDVEARYADWPGVSRAGWGYTLLPHGLVWDRGGPFQVHALAFDSEEQVTLLGSATISLDTAASDAPFGTIETPASEAIVAATAYGSLGRVVTRAPRVIPPENVVLAVDGAYVRAPACRAAPAVATMRCYALDATRYENGLHTLRWRVTDNAGYTAGVSGPVFRVENPATAGAGPSGAPRLASAATVSPRLGEPASVIGAPDPGTPVVVVRGWTPEARAEEFWPHGNFPRRVPLAPLERLAIQLPGGASPGMRYRAYQLAAGRLRRLPVGSSLDTSTGAFSWDLLPHFLGTYDFVFVREKSGADQERFVVTVDIEAER